MVHGRDPDTNVMVCPVGQGRWAFRALVWLEGEAERNRVDVQQLARLIIRGLHQGPYLHRSCMNYILIDEVVTINHDIKKLNRLVATQT